MYKTIGENFVGPPFCEKIIIGANLVVNNALRSAFFKGVVTRCCFVPIQSLFKSSDYK